MLQRVNNRECVQSDYSRSICFDLTVLTLVSWRYMSHEEWHKSKVYSGESWKFFTRRIGGGSNGWEGSSKPDAMNWDHIMRWLGSIKLLVFLHFAMVFVFAITILPLLFNTTFITYPKKKKNTTFIACAIHVYFSGHSAEFMKLFLKKPTIHTSDMEFSPLILIKF
jgi:hypothetical protein